MTKTLLEQFSLIKIEIALRSEDLFRRIRTNFARVPDPPYHAIKAAKRHDGPCRIT